MEMRPTRVNANAWAHICSSDCGVFLEEQEFLRALQTCERDDDLVELNDHHVGIWRELQSQLAAGNFIQSQVCLPNRDPPNRRRGD